MFASGSPASEPGHHRATETPQRNGDRPQLQTIANESFAMSFLPPGGEGDNARTLGPHQLILARGYQTIPIIPPGRPVSERSSIDKASLGKIPGVLRPDGTCQGVDWQHLKATTALASQWDAWGFSVGARLSNSLIAIDCDTLDPTLSELVLYTLQEVLGEQASKRLYRRFGRRPKWLVPLNFIGEIKYTRVEFDGYEGMRERVELLGAGRQCVVYGVHPLTGKLYGWETADGLPTPDGLPPPVADLPFANAEKVQRIFALLKERLPNCSKPMHEGSNRDAAPVNQDALRGKIEDVRRAVRALPNTSEFYPTRGDYLKVGYAIKAALPDDEDEAFDLWAEWGSRWSDAPAGKENTVERMQDDWRRMYGEMRVGAPWLFKEAEAHSGGAFREADTWFEPVEVSTSEAPRAEAAPARRWPISTAAEAAQDALRHSKAPLVKRVLDQGALSMLYGETNAGKTFVVLDLAAHVAMGREWLGRRVAQTGVMYVATEGGGGIRKRIRALADRYGETFTQSPFILWTGSVDLTKPGDDAQLVECAKHAPAPIGFIVIDTLHRALAGKDENSPEGMGALIKTVDRIREGTGAHVMLLHHPGKEANKGARGHSSLKAALDTELFLRKDEGSPKAGRLEVTKQRDLDGSFAVGFRLIDCTIGRDVDGDPVTSCTVHFDQPTMASAPVREKPAKGVETSILDILTDREARGLAGATVAEIAEALGLPGGPEKARKTVRTYTSKLKRRKLIEKREGEKWHTTAIQTQFCASDFLQPVPDNVFD